MFSINVTNNYAFPVNFEGTPIAPGGGTFSTGSIGGTKIFDVPGVGPICVLDLGMAALPGYSYLTDSWGVLIRYQTVEVYARYEAEGQFNFVIDIYGDLQVESVSGPATLVQLPGLSIKQQVEAPTEWVKYYGVN